jgi:hypothetical protein
MVPKWRAFEMKSLMKKVLAIALPAVAAAIVATTPANAQSGVAEITLYEHPGFQGQSRTFFGEVQDLGPERFNDVASSIRIRGAAFRVCEAYRLGGRCVTIERDVADLNQLGMNDVISSVTPVYNGGGYPGGGYGDRPRPEGRSGLTLYEGFGYAGRSVRLNGPTDNLSSFGFNDLARSLSVGREQWYVCEHAAYQGRCEIVGGDVADLGSIRLIGQISSARPVNSDGGWNDGGSGGGYPPYGGSVSRPDAQGRTSAFFARPTQGGREIFTGRGNAERAADDFCRFAGYRDAAYFSTNGGSRRGEVLEDVLCVR